MEFKICLSLHVISYLQRQSIWGSYYKVSIVIIISINDCSIFQIWTRHVVCSLNCLLILGSWFFTLKTATLTTTKFQLCHVMRFLRVRVWMVKFAEKMITIEVQSDWSSGIVWFIKLTSSSNSKNIVQLTSQNRLKQINSNIMVVKGTSSSPI